MKKKLLATLTVIAVLGLTACQQNAGSDAPVATPTTEVTKAPETPAATATVAPTEAPTEAPTATPEPTVTNTPAPTATPEPTATNTPVPTATPTLAPTATPTPEPTVEPTRVPEEIALADTDIPGIYWRAEYMGEDFGWPGEFMVIRSDGTIYTWTQAEEGSEDATVSKIEKLAPYNADAVSYAGQGDYLLYMNDEYESIIIYSSNPGRTPFVGYDYDLEFGAGCNRVESMPEGYYVPGNVVFENGGPSVEVTPEPTATVAPTATPEPTPTLTAKPTATPVPTSTPTPKPTATPVPTTTPTPAPVAQGPKDESYLEYEQMYGRKSYCVKGIGTCELTKISIPETYNGYPVVEIEAGAFKNNQNLVSVNIPGSIEKIKTSAFKGCTNLTTVVLEEGVKWIGWASFEGCTSLTNIEIPDSLTVIDMDAFSKCASLTSIELPDGIVTIDEMAFYGCSSLTTINLPASLRNIGEDVFKSCHNLTNVSVTLGSYAEEWLKENPVIFEMGQVVDGYEVLDHLKYSINGYKECVIDAVKHFKLSKVAFPEEIDGYPVGIIDSEVFGYEAENRARVTDIKLPNGLRQISPLAFSECINLESIEIPDSVTKIGGSAFSGCSSLKEVKLPKWLTKIESDIFRGCTSLERVEIPDGVMQIFGGFEGCTSLKSITIPESVEYIGSYTFSGCTSLTSVEILGDVTSIGASAFSGCTNLTSITIPESVTFIGKDAFEGCENLTNIEVTPGSYAENYLMVCKVGPYKNAEVDIRELMKPDYNGNIDWLVGEGFDHIPVPCIDSFYYGGLDVSTRSNAFQFGNRPEWEEVWYDSYDYFLIANGSPMDEYGSPLGAFNAFHTGSANGYEYLYYGFSQGASNGWGEIVVYPAPMHQIWESGDTDLKKEDFEDSYWLEITYTHDEEYMPEYRSATTMLLSWIIPNPAEVEQVIYDFFTDETGQDPLSKQIMEEGMGLWLQIGDVDVRVMHYDFENEEFIFAIRETGNPSPRPTRVPTATPTPRPTSTPTPRPTSTPTPVPTSTPTPMPTTAPQETFTPTPTPLAPAKYKLEGDTLIFYDGDVVDQILVYNAIKECGISSRNLKKVVMEEGILSIEPYAFYSYKGLTSVEIPDSVMSIGEGAFMYCESLTSIKLPGSLTEIGECVFEGCSSLTSVEIPGNVKSVGRKAFAGCISLMDIALPGSVTSIGASAFEGCMSLTVLKLPEGVTSIDYWTFSGCSGLTDIYIPGSVTSIAEYIFVFDLCTALETIHCPAGSYAETYARENNIAYITE